MNNRQGYISYQLREMMKQSAIPSVFTDPQNPDDFIAGYVRAIGPKTCLIESIGPYGRYEGWFAMRLSCVIEVMQDEQYAQRLLRLMELNGEQERGLPDDKQNWTDGDCMALLLSYAMENQRVVTCWTADEAFTGLVDQLDDLYATMVLLDFMGRSCAEQKIKLVDVELASLGSEEEMMYEKLNADK